MSWKIKYQKTLISKCLLALLNVVTEIMDYMFITE